MARMDMSGMGAGPLKGFVDGAGGYSYKLLGDGSYQILGPSGRMTYAKPGTRAHDSIAMELAGEENLYGVEDAGAVEVGPESDFESSSDDERARRGYKAAAEFKATMPSFDPAVEKTPAQTAQMQRKIRQDVMLGRDGGGDKYGGGAGPLDVVSMEDRIKALEDKLFGAQSMDEPFPTSPVE